MTSESRPTPSIPSVRPSTLDSQVRPAAASPAPVVDPLARQLGAALVIGLLLVLPFAGALGTRTDGALTASILGSVVAVLGIGYLLRWAGVPRARAVALTVAGTYCIVAIAGVWFATTMSDPPDDAGIAMLVGLPAGALSAAVAVVVAQRAKDFAPAAAMTTAVIGAFVAMIGGAPAGAAIDDARDDALMRTEFEQAGLSAYAPQIDGMIAEYTGATYRDADTNRAVGYELTYRPETDEGVQPWESASVDVKIAVGELDCQPIDDYLTCRDGGGYIVEERDGEVGTVQVQKGGTVLVATFYTDGESDLPDADTVGAALAAAESVDWDDVFALRD